MRIIVALIVVAVLLLVFIGVDLYRLKGSITRYQEYWKTRANEPGEITYIAVGDSAAQGVGASKPELGYVGLLTNKIADKTNKTVRVVNLSVSGAKVADVIRDQIPQLANYKADIITLEIGGNEVAGKFNAQTFEKEYSQLMSQLPKHTVVANIPYFGGRIRHNAQAIEASSIIEKLSAQKGFVMVDLQQATRTKNSILNYSVDIFHPSNHGYQVWADAFWQTVETKL